MKYPELHDRIWMTANRHRPAREIASELGCAKATVQLYRQRLGIRGTATSKGCGGGQQLILTITDKELRARLLSGETLEEIASEYGVTRQCVDKRARRAGLRRGWVYRPDTETAEEVAA